MGNTVQTLHERLFVLMQKIPIGTNEMGKLMGTSGSYVSSMLKKRGSFGINKLLSIFNAHPEINPEWLFFGEGEMLRDAHLNAHLNAHPLGQVSEKTGEYRLKERVDRPPIQINYPEPDNNTKLIPYIDSRAAAGLPASYENTMYWQGLPTMPVAATDFKYGTHIAIQVAGDSMQPRLNPGDILFAKFLDSPQEDIRDNYVHIVVTREGTVVKRLLNRLKDKGFLTLKSDNPAYTSYTEKHDNVLQVWRVEAFMSFNLASPMADIHKQLNDHESRLTKLEKNTK